MIAIKFIAVLLVLLHIGSIMVAPSTVGKERPPTTEGQVIGSSILSIVSIMVLLVLVVRI